MIRNPNHHVKCLLNNIPSPFLKVSTMDVFSFEFVLLLRGHKAIGVLPSQNREAVQQQRQLAKLIHQLVNEKTNVIHLCKVMTYHSVVAHLHYLLSFFCRYFSQNAFPSTRRITCVSGRGQFRKPGAQWSCNNFRSVGTCCWLEWRIFSKWLMVLGVFEIVRVSSSICMDETST